LRQTPGVASASVAAIVPLSLGGIGYGGVTAPDATPSAGRRSFKADWNIVEPGYFATMRTRLVAGRDFTAQDDERAARVVIVNETVARTLWPGRDAIGRTLLVDEGRDPMRPLTVVGVAADGRYRSLGDVGRLFVYVPLQQLYAPQLTIVARSVDGRRLATDIRRLLTSMDRNLPIISAQTMEEYGAVGLVPQRIAASVAATLGLVGLVLAAMGIYGVTAYMVARRTREIGIRIALGAQRRDVLRMVLGHGAKLAGVGVAIGLPLAAAASLVLESLLFGVPPIDPLTFAGTVVLFGAMGLAASYLPARRALRVDAMEALRYE
jgi:putative ABC transport system permease protein